MSIDYAKVIADCLTVHSIVEVEQGRSFPLSEGEAAYAARCILTATKVPDLCPDCEGTGEVERDTGAFGTIALHVCDHPNAPTIAKMLAIGEAVWTAEVEYLPLADSFHVHINKDTPQWRCAKWAHDLLSKLRSVEP